MTPGASLLRQAESGVWLSGNGHCPAVHNTARKRGDPHFAPSVLARHVPDTRRGFRSRLLRNSHRWLERNEFEPHRFGLGSQFDLLPFLIANLVGGELGVVKLLT